jgi:CubicO group peptidase (beta-lactamase class C family)
VDSSVLQQQAAEYVSAADNTTKIGHVIIRLAMKRPLLGLVLFLLLAPPLPAATRQRLLRVTPAQIATAAQVAANHALANGAPGVSIAVARHGQLVYTGAFGITRRETLAPVRVDSVFQVGSITKQFVAAGIMRLQERGQLSVDDDIRVYVPTLDTHGTTIRLSHLLTHTSGLIDFVQLITNAYEPLTRDHFVEMVNSQPLLFPPGEAWSYSNSGYFLLAMVLEKVSGVPAHQFIHDEFVLPLGLLHTGVCGAANAPAAPDGFAQVNGQWIDVPAIEMSNAYGAGDLCSTATDLVLWSQALASGRVVSNASYEQMRKATKLTNGSQVAYGFGLGTGNKLGRPAVWHTGGIAGFQSALAYYANEELSVAVLVNALPAPASVDSYGAESSVAAAALAAYKTSSFGTRADAQVPELAFTTWRNEPVDPSHAAGCELCPQRP